MSARSDRPPATPGEQRPEQGEEDQRLQQREDQRERVAQDRQGLADPDRLMSVDARPGGRLRRSWWRRVMRWLIRHLLLRAGCGR